MADLRQFCWQMCIYWLANTSHFNTVWMINRNVFIHWTDTFYMCSCCADCKCVMFYLSHLLWRSWRHVCLLVMMLLANDVRFRKLFSPSHSDNLKHDHNDEKTNLTNETCPPSSFSIAHPGYELCGARQIVHYLTCQHLSPGKYNSLPFLTKCGLCVFRPTPFCSCVVFLPPILQALCH